MDIPLDLDLLATLSATPGIPGREEPVASVICSALPENFQICRDALGNVTARRPGGGPRLMLLAHMDEVSLMVRQITAQGFLQVERLGGISIKSLPGSRLQLWSDKGVLTAQAGVLPQHLDSQPLPEIRDVYIDIGACSRQQAQEMGVQIGDGLTWYSPLQKVNDTRVSAKALDDRLGCFSLVSLAREIASQALPCDLTLAFIVQEETMLSGGKTVAEKIAPDIILGIDGTLAFDTPDLFGQQSEILLGHGPALKWMDAIRSKNAVYVPHLELAKSIRSLAQRSNIPLQDEVVTGISTALTPLPYTSGGIKTAAISLPLRYHHTPVEMADLQDVQQLINLLVAFIAQPF